MGRNLPRALDHDPIRFDRIMILSPCLSMTFSEKPLSTCASAALRARIMLLERGSLARPAALAVKGLNEGIVGARLVNRALSGRIGCVHRRAQSRRGGSARGFEVV